MKPEHAKAKYERVFTGVGNDGYTAGAMNQAIKLSNTKRVGYSACPHDCPSTCALDVHVLDERTIGRVHGAKDNDYTAGVICAKVARYAERDPPSRSPDCIRCGATAPRARPFAPISWDDALDVVAEKFLEAEQRHGAESRLAVLLCRHHGPGDARRHQPAAPRQEYSGFHSSICVNPAYAGFAAGTGLSPAPIRARWRSPIWW